MFLWALGFGGLAVLRHFRFLTQRFDTGNMTQAVRNTADGHFLEVTNVAGEQVNRLGTHVDPMLAMFAPLWWAWPSPAMLLVVQAVALACGAFPVFWLARKHLGSEWAGAKLALVYLLFPPLQWNVIHEFHAVALAVPLLLLAVWYLDERRLAPFAACAVGAVLTKEHIGLVIACLGLCHALRSRRVGQGLAIFGLGTTWTVVAFWVIVPHFSGRESVYQARYDWVGGTPSGIAKALFTDPERFLDVLARPSNGLYLIFLLLPLLGVCLLSPLMIAAIPQFALSMLSERLGDTNFTYQNALPVIPILVSAAVLGAARIARNPNATANRILFASIVLAVAIGPPRHLDTLGEIPGAENLSFGSVAAQRRAVELVPADGAVSSTNNIGAHLSARRRAYVFPEIARADWVVVDTHDPWLPTPPSAPLSGIVDGYPQPVRMARTIGELERSPDWRLVFREDGVLVFTRVS